MSVFRVVLIATFHFGVEGKITLSDAHPDFELNITQTIEKYGYPCESHEITTKDGYILNMFRIPHGKGGSRINRKPIFLMHGLFGEAENFVTAGMYDASLAYHLADDEFDVWMGNSRGTKHGRRHVTLDPHSMEFWDFSWHEIGMIDVPMSIDYILEKRKMEKLYYIGHSQGGTVFYVMTSMRPEYQKKIIMASLLAPGGYMGNFNNPPISLFVQNFLALQIVAPILYEFLPESVHFSTVVSEFCSFIIFQGICSEVYINYVAGQDSKEIPRDILPVAIKYVPSVSRKQILHFSQSARSDQFRLWDYGRKGNLINYGTPLPPDYPIKSINVPIAVYYAQGDNLVAAKDIDRICEELPNVVRKYLVPKPEFTHIDFVLASHKSLLVHPVMEFLKKYVDDSTNAA